MTLLPYFEMLGGPYASVLDVGGSVGDFAKACYMRWPDARIISFEALSDQAAKNHARAQGRWRVQGVALGAGFATATMQRNTRVPAVSTLLEPGSARASLGIADVWQTERVPIAPLDEYISNVLNPCLLKIDVEGYELQVLEGAQRVLDYVETVVIEVQNDPDIFVGSPGVDELDSILRYHGLRFSRLAAAYLNPRTEVVMQYDAVWMR